MQQQIRDCTSSSEAAVDTPQQQQRRQESISVCSSNSQSKMTSPCIAVLRRHRLWGRANVLSAGDATPSLLLRNYAAAAAAVHYHGAAASGSTIRVSIPTLSPCDAAAAASHASCRRAAAPAAAAGASFLVIVSSRCQRSCINGRILHSSSRANSSRENSSRDYTRCSSSSTSTAYNSSCFGGRTCCGSSTRGSHSSSCNTSLLMLRRCFATIGVSDVRQGCIVFLDGKPCEITEWRQIKSGRGAASIGLSYIDLNTFKSGDATFNVGKKLELIQPEKKPLTVMYVDESKGVVVLADAQFDEMELSLKLFGGAAVAPFLKPEVKVVVYLHEGTPIKVSLPPAVVQQMKSKK